MTATTTDATPLTTRPAVSNRLPRTAAITDAMVIGGRNLKDLVRTPQLIVFSVVQTVLFVLLFRYVFGGSIQIPGMSYTNFIVCGFMGQIAIFEGFGTAVAMAQDSKSGLIDRFRALPMARSAVVGGRAAADLLRQLALVVIVVLVGFAIGFTVEGTWLGVLAAIGLCVVWGFAMFWVFAALGLFVRDSETAQAASTPFFVLVFVSSSVILVDTLPGWLQPFARNQPLTLVCNAVRGLVEGDAGAALSPETTGHYVIMSLIWCVGITLVFAPLAVYAYRRP